MKLCVVPHDIAVGTDVVIAHAIIAMESGFVWWDQLGAPVTSERLERH